MLKSALLTTWVVLLVALLGLSGLAVLWWSSELMLWLIWLIGEEYALGQENVV